MESRTEVIEKLSFSTHPKNELTAPAGNTSIACLTSLRQKTGGDVADYMRECIFAQSLVSVLAWVSFGT